MPHRVQLSRRKGWRLPANTIVVARPTRWGNPFRIAKPTERELRAEAKRCLRGSNLACWCPLDGPCHAEVLLEIVNDGV